MLAYDENIYDAKEGDNECATNGKC